MYLEGRMTVNGGSCAEGICLVAWHSPGANMASVNLDS
jgi:hypothetical protein